MGFMDTIADAGKSLVGITDKAIIYVGYNKRKDKYTRGMSVQYNPSSIRMSTSAGTFQQVSMGGDGINQVTQVCNPAQTNFSVTLIFDKCNPQDAFMFDKITNLSVGAAVSDIAGGIKAGLDDDAYSVQPQVEGLIAQVMQKNRKTKFCWSDLSFEGELTNVDAKYTMFNPIGKPVRAEVNIHLQRNQERIDQMEKDWNKKFDKVFGGQDENKAVDDNDWTSWIQNIINL